MRSEVTMIRALLLLLCIAGDALAAAPPAAPTNPAPVLQDEESKYQYLKDAANAVVGVKVKALANARSAQTLGVDRMGSGVLIEKDKVVLTIGYLILEAEQVEVITHAGRAVPAVVVAYDHATGFGLLRPLVPLEVKPIKLGASSRVEANHRMLIAGAGGEDALSVATVVSRRKFAGYWEYFLDSAIFTTPPRPDFGGAALIDRHGELVGIGSLFVMDAQTPGERLPGNMFVPIDLLKPILAEMLATGRQKAGMRPWLGVSSVEEDGRVKVIRVSADGPAEKAGIAPGDIILGLAGENVESLDSFYKRLWAAGEPGVEVTLKVLKGTQVRELRIRTIDRFEHIRKKPTI
jgi:S1-C subfamily serine protease